MDEGRGRRVDGGSWRQIGPISKTTKHRRECNISTPNVIPISKDPVENMLKQVGRHSWPCKGTKLLSLSYRSGPWSGLLSMKSY